jgi:hypothetical protein
MSTRALIVGIAQYANPKNNLDGVENDVSAMVKVLGKFGISDIEVIRDSNATAENIRKGLRNLVVGSVKNDTRIFYYSGHGALLPSDFSGSDDKDGRDEALVPYEGTLSSLILDNWIASFLKNVLPPGVFIWSIYDSCHSGEMYKYIADIEGLPSDAKAMTNPKTKTDAKVKMLTMGDLVVDSAPLRLSTHGPLITTKDFIIEEDLPTSIHIGAAEPNTTALVQTIERVRRSVFTWALEQVTATGMTVADFEKKVTEKQASITSHHKPQIAASKNNMTRTLFS